MLIQILIGVIVLLIMLAIVIQMQPGDFEYERSMKINSDPASIFPYINDLEKWQTWSPWARMEPDANYNITPNKAGVGAAITWEGKKTGSGQMTNTESLPNERVKYRLEFYKPMAGISTAQFDLKTEGAATLVIWRMHGDNNFMGKAITLLMNCKKMMDTQFDAGLANLKAIVEK